MEKIISGALSMAQFKETTIYAEMCETVASWDAALIMQDKESVKEDCMQSRYYKEQSAVCAAKWEVFKMILKWFFETEYFFTRTDDYFGICTEDESDYLLKVEREA